ncbi:probable galactinol--sucrose galactosyltransferase 6 isoform X1 [Raphanus sativus]|uniref:galactinol--sucrose galactosyltransferase n=2 Tax=Raphanus sativus TaxID=3726 RepID=A0A6J0KAB0_RAPSA|nr:probable galactinol--sucrose galactosyltransferase 6 isoform X1 [Raphanus sativus]
MASQGCFNGINSIKRVHPLFHSLTYRFSSSYLQLKSKPRARILSSSQLRLSSGLGYRRHCSSSSRRFHSCSYKRSEAASPLKRSYIEKEEEMTIKPAVRISDGNLIIKNRTILTGLPDNVITTTASEAGPVEGVFVGAVFDAEQSNHIVPIGKLHDSRFMSCFRFKLWWMAQRMGQLGRDIPLETQFLLTESNDGSHLEPDGVDGGTNQKLYTVFLPLIEGSFRSCLQGNVNDEVELCLESGDADTKTSSFTHSLYIHAGTDPFQTITEAIHAVKLHLKSFRQRHEKKLPGIVDYFGWCTWDAFYQEVTQEGVEEGLNSLTAGDTPPKFVIIDDGWQSVENDDNNDPVENPVFRLTGIEENAKFKNKDDPRQGIKNIVDIAKEKHGLKYVYVWHAITGYWGGVRPGEEYGSSMKYPMVSKAVVENEPTWKTDVMAVQGLGLVNPKNVYRFYNELHSYLAAAGVDGVKVDVQCILETLGGGLGGRVELTRQYHQALDSSVAKNFPDNGCIACMSHNTDALYCSKQAAVIRASDDFYPRDPVSHTIHIASVAYNSVFLGEFMLPDWDMFHSVHPAAEYHASARAISGGPIYVSDAPGKHNFDLLRKLVLPDGSILRARLPGRPTRDCLFTDPARDGVSLLKIWNMNKYTGVLGVYNCQGAAWSSTERKNIFHQTNTDCITGSIRGRDVHLISEASTDPATWNGDCAVYSQSRGELNVIPYNVSLPISLKIREHEIFTVSPICHLATTDGVSFAPLGLVNMYNSGGAVEGLRYDAEKMKVVMEVKGCGKFGAYSSVKPKRCVVESSEIAFEYDVSSGLVTFELDKMPSETKTLHVVEVQL